MANAPSSPPPVHSISAETVRHVTDAVNAEVGPLLTVMSAEQFTLEYTVTVTATGIRSLKVSPHVVLLPGDPSTPEQTARLERITAVIPEALTAIVLLTTLLHDMTGDLVLTRCNEISAPAVD